MVLYRITSGKYKELSDTRDLEDEDDQNGEIKKEN
jgi:hypothetical protein